MDGNDILPYVEPIYRFCRRRLYNRSDAEDLASEILCHILAGMQKYRIESLDAWVWRVAHNRYARFIDAQNRTRMVLSEVDPSDMPAYDDPAEAAETEHTFETVFRSLHTLSAAYRDLFVDHYIDELSVKALSEKYALPESTVKWRLNVGRQRIRERIDENAMEKIYKRINWNTRACNGSMDPDQYLHTQLARAICQAAYEEPLTVEEISLATGIPALYIEDELPRLLYGEAVCKIGKNYATNFIISRLRDRKTVETISEASVKALADRLEELFREKAEAVRRMNFCGHDFGMERLGHLLVPYLLRRKIATLKNERLHLGNGPCPPRKDGGYGWFIVQETADERECVYDYAAGCNVSGDDSGGKGPTPGHYYYYWIGKYLNDCWLCANGHFPQADGSLQTTDFTDEELASLLQKGFAVKTGNGFRWNVAGFTEAQFAQFTALFDLGDRSDETLLRWIRSVRDAFASFVSKRLDGQINQWVSSYLSGLAGQVTEELIRRGVLRGPQPDHPLTDGIFYIAGKYIDP